MQNINPFELLKEELDTDEIASRVNTIHKLPIVATLMTSDAIKNNLLPYLDSLIKREDDQVVFAITEQFTTLAPLLGAQHTLILPYLENLCAHDETVVRERAVTSVSKLLSNYTDNQITIHYPIDYPIVFERSQFHMQSFCRPFDEQCLSQGRCQQGKNQAVNLIVKQKIHGHFQLRDATAAESHRYEDPQMCQVYEKEYLISDLISILKHRSTDEQDQIRVLAIQSFKSISKMLTRDENKTFIMPLIIQAADDKSWRVRLSLAKNFTDIAESFGKEVTDMSLIQTYGNLLKDAEPEVKIEAVKLLSGFIKIVSADKISVLIPQVLGLGKDPMSIVRSYVGGVISNMIGSISKDQAYQNIQPLVKDLMKDDQQEVRKGGILAAVKFVEVMGIETIGSLQANLKTASEDHKWRVRLQLIRNIADLSIRVENSDIFTKHFEPLFIIYLKDRAASIRKMGAHKVGQLAAVYGNNWASSFMGKLSEIIAKESSYHYKISALYSVKQISLNSGDNLEKGASIIMKASIDAVPNVRQVCVKCLKEIAVRWEKNAIKDAIKKHIAGMMEDTDKQVREIASEMHSKI